MPFVGMAFAPFQIGAKTITLRNVIVSNCFPDCVIVGNPQVRERPHVGFSEKD